MTPLSLAVFIIAIALVFDYINGFHDAANSIATIVATRVLSPFQAVAWAAFFNFVAAFLFGTAVANTVGKGFVNLELVTPYVILAGLIGAIAWDLITWWFGLPTSSSHALIGGYAGAAVAHAGLARGVEHSLEGLIIGKWPLTVTFIFAAPLIGLISAFALMIALYWLFQGSSPSKMDKWFRKLQLISAAAFSLSHGSNDAQKTMGIITGVLVASGFQKGFEVHIWVILAAHAAIALGTLSGGWRIVHTMGGRLTRLRPRSGFCAETGAAGAVLLATHLGLPVSTTHAIAGAIAGVGSIQRMKAVRWGIATNIVWAWVLTIPAAAIIAWCSFVALHLVIGA
ncbi:putative low-affinity inorganic phosphate transporter [Candidatus Sulfopaludibacter sp. SbA3]|nr:putative low-affinity inorganic phosphate transporter [Candidatus Sulfopaludibacter sp. SbA3]